MSQDVTEPVNIELTDATEDVWLVGLLHWTKIRKMHPLNGFECTGLEAIDVGKATSWHCIVIILIEIDFLINIFL